MSHVQLAQRQAPPEQVGTSEQTFSEEHGINKLTAIFEHIEKGSRALPGICKRTGKRYLEN